MVLSPNDRNPDCRLSHSMRRFNEVLNVLGLIDLPLQGGPFTWRGGHDSCHIRVIRNQQNLYPIFLLLS